MTRAFMSCISIFTTGAMPQSMPCPGMTLTPRAFGTSRTEGPGGKADDVELAASFHFGLDDIENGQNARAP